MDDPLGKTNVKTLTLTETENYWRETELNLQKYFLEFLSHITTAVLIKAHLPMVIPELIFLKT